MYRSAASARSRSNGQFRGYPGNLAEAATQFAIIASALGARTTAVAVQSADPAADEGGPSMARAERS
jgi:hypothetical protein